MINVFLSYAPEDEQFKIDLAKHLEFLRRQGTINTLNVSDLSNGWEDSGITTADVILLLVSSDFIFNPETSGTQLQTAIERHNKKEALVIPVILRKSDWTTSEFGKLRALPSPNGTYPVEDKKWFTKDEAYLDIVTGVKSAIGFLKKQKGNLGAPKVSAADGKMRILFMEANPKDSNRLRVTEEIREIKAKLLASGAKDRIVFEEAFAVRIPDIKTHLLQQNPNILHFSGHGTGDGGLVFESTGGTTALVETEALTDMIALFENISCVFLNACYADVQAQALIKIPHVQYVIGMKTGVPDATAIAFSAAFYEALGYGKEFEFAFDLAKASLKTQKVNTDMVVLLKKML